MNAATVTTFQRFNGTQPGNYCHLPRIDVEILTSDDLCGECPRPIRYEQKMGLGKWVHEDGSAEHRARRRQTCKYCGCNDKDTVAYHQHPWYDAVECTRCGGVHGWGIGD